MNNQTQQFKPLKHLKYPLTPYQLFSPVSTVFLDNLTYEEQLLGLYKLYNEFITEYNKLIPVINELQEWVDKLPDELDAIKASITALTAQLLQAINTLNQAIITGDANTLDAAHKYTDEKFNQLQPGGSGTASFGITASEYDGMNLAAVDYDDMEITAREYDLKGRILFFGDVSTIYLQFKSSVTADALDTVFDLANAPPLKLGRRYQFEISLGNFSLNSSEPAHLEIVGSNTLGNTIPITIPNGGSSSIVGIFNQQPSTVRLMSGEDEITGYNAYIKIKPLGEA